MAGGFGFNTNLLETNLINLTAVIGILVYFGKGLLSNLLTARKSTILSALRDAEDRYQAATEKLNQARALLQQAKDKAEATRLNGFSQIDREKEELIKAADEDYRRLEDSKQATIHFEEQRAVEEVRRQVSRLALAQAFKALNRRLNATTHTRMIDYHIGLLKAMERVTD
jgi:F-type H+-transporting ATPase subunit b